MFQSFLGILRIVLSFCKLNPSFVDLFSSCFKVAVVLSTFFNSLKALKISFSAVTGLVSGFVVSFVMPTVTDVESVYSPLVSIGATILLVQIWDKFINSYKNVNQDFW